MVTEALLGRLADDASGAAGLRYAVVNSAECVTGRHLIERSLAKVADAVPWDGAPGRCESISQLAVGLSKMLVDHDSQRTGRFVLVFDGIDRQREAPPTLVPALARLSEMVLLPGHILPSPSPSLCSPSFCVDI